MKHIINGCPIYLRGLTEQELDNLVISTELRLARVQEELGSLKGEAIRRGDKDQPTLAMDVPPYLRDPA